MTPSSSPPLYLLKLGGSLITDKAQPHTARPDVLDRLAAEIAAAFRQRPRLQLVLGHGSGSFGHVPARRWGTRQGVRTPEAWGGFVEVWREAAALDSLVLTALANAGLPALALPPSASVVSRGGKLLQWDLDPLRLALAAGLLPVVYGDVIFDQEWGGTIFSTEDLFGHLAHQLHPERILLAGLEPGVWGDYPDRTHLHSEITPDGLERVLPALGGSAAADVTGGMVSKVRQGLALAQSLPGLEVFIFSGLEPGAVRRALLGEKMGTCLHTGIP